MTLPTSACHSTVLKELRDFPAQARPSAQILDGPPVAQGLTPVNWPLDEGQRHARPR
jgi:hypothetical protein